MSNLSEVKKADIFYCQLTPLYQKGDLRYPNEQSAGLKESGASTIYKGFNQPLNPHRRSREMKKYQIIYADPPWKYQGKMMNSSVTDHYQWANLKDICSIPVGGYAMITVFCLCG